MFNTRNASSDSNELQRPTECIALPRAHHTQLSGKHAFVAYRLILLFLHFVFSCARLSGAAACMGTAKQTHCRAKSQVHQRIVNCAAIATTSLVTSKVRPTRRTRLHARKRLFNVKMRKTIEIVATLS